MGINFDIFDPDEPVPFHLIKKANLFSFITLSRMNHSFYIEQNYGPDYEPYEVIISKENLKEKFLTNIESGLEEMYKKSEASFFATYILTMDIIGIDKFENIDIPKWKIGNNALDMSEKWIVEFVRFFKVDLSAKAYFFLYINIYHHFIRQGVIKESGAVVLGKMDATNVSGKDNEYLWDKALAFFNYVSTVFSMTPKSKFVYYLLIRDAVFSSRIKVRIQVISSLADIQKKNIENEIKKNAFVPVEFCEETSGEPNIILSDYYFEKAEMTNTNNQVVFTKSLPTKEDYFILNENLMEIYEHLLAKKMIER